MVLLLLGLAPAYAGDVIVYADLVGYPSQMAEAATLAGHTVSLYDRDGVGFQADWSAGAVDLVMVESGWNYVPPEADAVLADAVAQGVPVIFSYWDLDADPALLALFGVSTLLSFTSPQPTIVAVAGDPYGLFNGVPALQSPMDYVSDDGDILAGGTILATSPAGEIITLTNGGRTIVNGFLPVNYHLSDGDADGRPDVQELLANEIELLLAPSPELQVTGTCPSSVQIDARNLTPNGDVAIARSWTRGTFSIPGGHCRGKALDLANPQLALMTTADPAGELHLTVAVPPGVCGAWIQVVDMDPCETTVPRRL
jgi:hypothetical protein